MSIAETDPAEFEVNAIKHDPGKYARVEDPTYDDSGPP
jgi:hypothetical protein